MKHTDIEIERWLDVGSKKIAGFFGVMIIADSEMERAFDVSHRTVKTDD